MDPRTFRIKSVSGSAWIEFRAPQKLGDDISFGFAVQFEHFSGVVRSSTFHSGTPVNVFLKASASWSDWDGDKIWRAIDGELLIRINGDVRGNRYVGIVMAAGAEKLQGGISLDTERLDRSAKRLRDFFDLTKNFPAEVETE